MLITMTSQIGLKVMVNTLFIHDKDLAELDLPATFLRNNVRQLSEKLIKRILKEEKIKDVR